MREYYVHHDFYNMESDDMLTILSHFPTYQQTTSSTCGPVCLKMALKYFGVDSDEMEIAIKTNCKIPGGTKIRDMETFLEMLGFEILSEKDFSRNKEGKIFDFTSFKNFVINNLKNGYPIIIENIDAGGHYRIIIGYDELSKFRGNEKNDILIFADPADTYDGKQDGYNYAPAYRTFKMWFDDHHLPPDQKFHSFIVVKGLKNWETENS